MSDMSISEMLEIAIGKEEAANRMYQDLALRVEEKEAKETLEYLAEEEKNHKRILEDYRQGKLKDSLALSKTIDYKIAEHTQRSDISNDSEMKDIYLFAAHEERDAYDFYMNLAERHAEGETRALLLKMANEEKKHKEKMEYYYTNSAFPQNAGG